MSDRKEQFTQMNIQSRNPWGFEYPYRAGISSNGDPVFDQQAGGFAWTIYDTHRHKGTRYCCDELTGENGWHTFLYSRISEFLFTQIIRIMFEPSDWGENRGGPHKRFCSSWSKTRGQVGTRYIYNF